MLTTWRPVFRVSVDCLSSAMWRDTIFLLLLAVPGKHLNEVSKNHFQFSCNNYFLCRASFLKLLTRMRVRFGIAVTRLIVMNSLSHVVIQNQPTICTWSCDMILSFTWSVQEPWRDRYHHLRFEQLSALVLQAHLCMKSGTRVVKSMYKCE